jgi:MFS family permease
VSASPPAISRGRLTAAALLSLASFAASINLVFAALVRMGDEFGVRPEILASISSIYFVAFFLVASASGFFSDRFGAKPPLLFGSLMTVAGGLIFASAHDVATLVIGAIVMGMGGGATEGMCTALLARIFPGRERFVVGVSQAGYCFGAIAGPYVMGIFLPLGVSWRLFFLPVAAMALANFGLFVGSRFPENQDAGTGRHGEGERGRRGDGETRRRGEAERVAVLAVSESDASSGTAGGAPAEPPLLRRPGVLRWCVVVFLYVTAETGLVSFVNIYLSQYRGAPERAAIQAISWFWAVMLVGRLLCSILPPAFADRRLIVGAMTGGAAAVLLAIPMPAWPGALGALLLASFLMAGTWPTIVAKAARDNPDRASTVVGITVAAGSLGCIIAPPVMGYLFVVAPPALAMAAPAIPLLAGSALAAWSSPRKAAHARGPRVTGAGEEPAF